MIDMQRIEHQQQQFIAAHIASRPNVGPGTSQPAARSPGRDLAQAAAAAAAVAVATATATTAEVTPTTTTDTSFSSS